MIDYIIYPINLTDNVSFSVYLILYFVFFSFYTKNDEDILFIDELSYAS